MRSRLFTASCDPTARRRSRRRDRPRQSGDRPAVPGSLLSAGSHCCQARPAVIAAGCSIAQLWGFDRQARCSKIGRTSSSSAAAAAAGDQANDGPALELARFYLARDMYPEAKAVLDLALADERPTAEDSTGLVMRAIANIMLGRIEDGLAGSFQARSSATSTTPRSGGLSPRPVWASGRRRGKAFRNGDQFDRARCRWNCNELVLMESIRARRSRCATTREAPDAAQRIRRARHSRPRSSPRSRCSSGRVAEGLGHNEEALAAYPGCYRFVSDRPVRRPGPPARDGVALSSRRSQASRT